MSFLIVVSHPDDEVLGCGGTAAKLSGAGHEVSSCMLSGAVEVRQNRPPLGELRQDIAAAAKVMGIGRTIVGDFPNISFNTQPHLALVRFVENAILETGATTIFTHHPDDLNDDHRHTSLACQAAARLFQRGADVPELEALYFMEVLSSTDWTYAGVGRGFRPDTFSEIGDSGVEAKLRALAAYRDVMRDFPHPRSEEIVRSQAAVRGGQAGVRYAEAFQTAFGRLRP